jgi:hypothetical protein
MFTVIDIVKTITRCHLLAIKDIRWWHYGSSVPQSIYYTATYDLYVGYVRKNVMLLLLCTTDVHGMYNYCQGALMMKSSRRQI